MFCIWFSKHMFTFKFRVFLRSNKQHWWLVSGRSAESVSKRLYSLYLCRDEIIKSIQIHILCAHTMMTTKQLGFVCVRSCICCIEIIWNRQTDRRWTTCGTPAPSCTRRHESCVLCYSFEMNKRIYMILRCAGIHSSCKVYPYLYILWVMRDCVGFLLVLSSLHYTYTGITGKLRSLGLLDKKNSFMLSAILCIKSWSSSCVTSSHND